jgi:peptide/nickel transport system substrate-binding protein
VSAPESSAGPVGASVAPSSPSRKGRSPVLFAIIIAVVLILVGVSAFFLWPRAVAGSTVVYATASEMITLDPSTEFSNSVLVLPNVYETLTFFDPATNQAKALLATNWQSSANKLEWTFTLRQGVRFHDGTPFNATAVKFSIERTMRLGQGAAFIWAPVANIDIVSEFQVRFTLNFPAPLDWIASADYGAYIMSPKIPAEARNPDGSLNDTKFADWFEKGNDLGSGPYRLDPAEYDKKTRAVFRRFVDYWGGWRSGQFDNAVIRVMDNPAAREAAVLAGEVDIVIDVPVLDLPSLQADSRVRVLTTPSYRSLLAFFNTEKTGAPTTNVLVRQALAHSIPYQDVITVAAGGLASQPIGVVPAGMWGHDATLPNYELNLTRAEELLVQAGYATEPRFALTLTHLQGELFESKFAELYKEKLETLGITLNIQAMEWPQQWALAQTGPDGAQVQDIFVMYWWPTYITPYDFLWNMFHTGSYAFFNLGYYQNPTFDALIDDASTLEATSRDQALAKYREAQLILYNDAPGVGVLDLKNLYVMRSDLKGFVDNPAYPLVVFFYHLSR